MFRTKLNNFVTSTTTRNITTSLQSTLKPFNNASFSTSNRLQTNLNRRFSSQPPNQSSKSTLSTPKTYSSISKPTQTQTSTSTTSTTIQQSTQPPKSTPTQSTTTQIPPKPTPIKPPEPQKTTAATTSTSTQPIKPPTSTTATAISAPIRDSVQKSTTSTSSTTSTIINNTESTIKSTQSSTSTPKAPNPIQSTSSTTTTSTTPPPKSTTTIIQSQPKKKRRLFRRLFQLSLISVIGLLTYQGVNSPGFNRSWAFWSQAFPIYLHYQVIIVWLDFRQWLTKILIKYDKEHYGPILQALNLDENGEPIDDIMVSTINTPIDSNNINNTNKDKHYSDKSNVILAWSEKKQQADLQYVQELHQLLERQQHSPTTTSTTTSSTTESTAEITSTSTTSPTQHLRPTPISDTINTNKLDRLFANFNSIAEHLRSSTEYQQLQQRLNELTQKQLTIDMLQNELPLLAQDTLAFHIHLPKPQQFIYFCKTQFNLLLGVLDEFNPLPPPIKAQINIYKQQFTQFIDKNIIATSIQSIAPHIRHLALPLTKREKKEHRDEQFAPLNSRYADDLYGIIAGLRGYYIKISQLGSMRAEFLPKEWVTELKRFQNDCPSTPFEQLIPMIESEIGSISSNFEYINPIPLGAASIGQAHRARLKNGQEVVIKLQYPEVEETFKHDMHTIRSFCELAQPEQLPQLAEIEQAFMSEFDFAREAVQLHFAAQDLTAAQQQLLLTTKYGNNNNIKLTDDENKKIQALNEFAKYVLIPRPIPHLCSKHCLVMEYLPGPRLSTFLERSVEKMAKEQNITTEEFLDKYGSTPPPTTEEIQTYKKLAASQDYLYNTLYSIYNWTFGWFTENYQYQKTTVPIDIRRIIKYTYEAHGNQVFNGHCLNSDCHPGNILWLSSENDPNNNNDLDGTIGLIDYGQVKSLPLYYRAILAHLMIALNDENWQRVADLCFFAGFRSVHNFQEQTIEQTVLGFDYDNEVTRRGMNIEAYFAYISSIDKPLVIQDKLALAGQTTFFLRALPQHLNFTAKASTYWAPIARSFLDKHPLLDIVIDNGIKEMGQYYQQQLIKAKAEAIRDLGTDVEYFVNLDDHSIQDWCEAIGQIYDKEFYTKIFTYPFPTSLIEFYNSPQGREYKLRHDELIQLTYNLNVNDFIPKQEQFQPIPNKHAKPYDFWSNKPTKMIDQLIQDYDMKTRSIKGSV